MVPHHGSGAVIQAPQTIQSRLSMRVKTQVEMDPCAQDYFSEPVAAVACTIVAAVLSFLMIYPLQSPNQIALQLYTATGTHGKHVKSQGCRTASIGAYNRTELQPLYTSRPRGLDLLALSSQTFARRQIWEENHVTNSTRFLD
jgi:hypothetical protein